MCFLQYILYVSYTFRYILMYQISILVSRKLPSLAASVASSWPDAAKAVNNIRIIMKCFCCGN